MLTFTKRELELIYISVLNSRINKDNKETYILESKLREEVKRYKKPEPKYKLFEQLNIYSNFYKDIIPCQIIGIVAYKDDTIYYTLKYLTRNVGLTIKIRENELENAQIY